MFFQHKVVSWLYFLRYSERENNKIVSIVLQTYAA